MKNPISFNDQPSFYFGLVDSSVIFYVHEKTFRTLLEKEDYDKLAKGSSIFKRKLFSYDETVLQNFMGELDLSLKPKTKTKHQLKPVYFVELKGIALIKKFFCIIKPKHLYANKQKYYDFLLSISQKFEILNKRLNDRFPNLEDQQRFGTVSPSLKTYQKFVTNLKQKNTPQANFAHHSGFFWPGFYSTIATLNDLGKSNTLTLTSKNEDVLKVFTEMYPCEILQQYGSGIPENVYFLVDYHFSFDQNVNEIDLIEALSLVPNKNPKWRQAINELRHKSGKP